MIIELIVIALYAAFIIVIGVIGMKKARTFNDFFLGSGAVGPWMTAFSYGTTYFSAVVFIGFAGKIGWNFGLSGIWIGVVNALVGVMGVWALLGWKIKKMSMDYQVQTMSEYFEKRFSSPFLKLFSSIIIFVFLIPYSAAVFLGLSYLFTAVFPVIEFWHAVAFMGIFTGIYIVMGGYKSMTMIDTFFGIIMTVGVLILLILTIRAGDGLGNITAHLRDIDPKLVAPVGPPGFWPLFSLIFLTSVAPFAMPQLVQKFYAIKDRRAIRFGMTASMLFALLIGCIAYFMGSTTRFFLTPDVAPAAFLADGQPNVDALVPALFTTVIPRSLFSIILLLILSASMSTLAALVLISSSSVAKDLYAGFINRNISDKSLTRLMRVFSGFFVLLSVILALLRPDTIVAILSISWGALGSTFLGPFIWGLFWKKTTKTAAIASMIIGLGTCVGLTFAGFPSPEAGTVGMLVSLAAPPLISLATGRKKAIS